jgi:hypothetical protein
MSKITNEDVQEYYLGNPCFAGVGDRIWTPDSEDNKTAFIDEVCETPIGDEFCRMFGPEDITPAWNKVLEIHRNRASIYGGEITFHSFVRCLTDAIRTGAIQTPPPPQPKPRELSSSQKAWQECADFAWGNKEKGIQPASSIQIDERKKTDPVFAAYIRKSVESDWNKTVYDGGLTPAVDPDEVPAPTAELLRFVEAYNNTSVADLKPRGGFVYVGGQKLPLSKFRSLQEWAANSHLI